METEKIILSGSPIEIAEYEDHKMATFLISVLDEYDLNGRMIPKESGELYHSSIIGFPILAKMVCNEAGDPVDFAGHEMYIVVDEEGNSQVRFNTHPIGSVVESWIEERAVSGYVGKKSCIMIKAKLWSTRYPEYFAVLDKLWAANNVKSSWELTVQEAVQTAKGRILKTFSFIGNTLLGSKVLGAVPGAGVYEYAELDPEIELAAALSKDVFIEDAQRKEDGVLENENVNQEQIVSEVVETEVETETVEAEVVETEVETPADETVEVEEAEMTEEVSEGEPAEAIPVEEVAETESAMLTDYDLRRRVNEAYRTQYDKWGWVSFWFPADNEAWIEYEGRPTEMDFMRVVYTVENDVVTITSAEPVKLTVSVAEINNALETRDNAIAKANERINELSAQVAALQPYKEAADQAEQERIEAEMAEKRTAFKEKMISSKLFTQDEIETSEALKAMIDCLDESALKAEIAERFMAKLDSEPETTTETAQAVEVANEETRVQVSEGEPDSRAFMRIFLGKN